MKRSRLSYDNWTCMLDRKLTVKHVSEPALTGHVSLLDIRRVTEPQTWQVQGRTITVCEDGTRWLCILPEDGGYCVTAMLDREWKIVLWYIDMIDAQGVDPDGVPWFFDLYLDLVVQPDGSILVDDRDELDEALAAGDITPQQHGAALSTAQKLMDGPLRDVDGFKAWTYACLNLVQGRQEA